MAEPDEPPPAVCPVCGLEVDDTGFSLCCDGCAAWVHGACEDMSASEGTRAIREYFCPNCVERHNQRLGRVAWPVGAKW